MSTKEKHITLQGELALCGDKSLSHRAIILSALAKGRSEIINFLPAEDTLNTLTAFTKLGVNITLSEDKTKVITNATGIEGLAKNDSTISIDVGNSGTAARLLLGLFAGISNLRVTIDGDNSLRKRPMSRVTNKLQEYGAQFSPTDFLPIQVKGTSLPDICIDEDLGSAQVKSAFLFAALTSNVACSIYEHLPSRDHTENMLAALDIPIKRTNEPDSKVNHINMKPPYLVSAFQFNVWGDISSAAFFLVAALHVPDSNLTFKNVLLNPFRQAYLNILDRMGANITTQILEKRCGEVGGSLEVKYSPNLHNTEIFPNEIPALIDEIPALVVAGLFAKGEFTVKGAKELRIKESDRIFALCSNLRSLGYTVSEWEDGFSFQGKPGYYPKGKIQGFQDHRIVMSFEIVRLIAHAIMGQQKETIEIDPQDRYWVQTSFPQFYEWIDKLTVT